MYLHHLEKAEEKIDIALNMCYFVINRIDNAAYAISICSNLKVEGYKHLYFKYMLMEAIKEYLINRLAKTTNRELVRNIQIGSVVLYNIYIELFKIKIFEATSNQIEYFDHLKNSVTTSKTTENFLKIGEDILKLRKDIMTLWDKIVELNPFSDESEKDYMLYINTILEDDALAKTEAKKYFTLKNNKLSERNNVYHSLFMHESSILLIDGHANNGKILYTTPNFPNQFLFSDKEILNTSIDDLIPNVVQTFHKDLVEDAIKFSNLDFHFKDQRDFLLKGKNGGLFNIKLFVKCIPNLTYGLIYIAYVRKVQELSFIIILDKDFKINGYTEMGQTGASFTMNNNYGITQNLLGHHIAAVLPEIVLQMEYKDGEFSIQKHDVDLKGNLYPVSIWKDLARKIELVLERIKELGKLQNPDEEQKNTIQEYDRLLKEITSKYNKSFSIFYKIVTRKFLNGKYVYHRLYITNDLFALNDEHPVSLNQSHKEEANNLDLINDDKGDGKNREIKFKFNSAQKKAAEELAEKELNDALAKPSEEKEKSQPKDEFDNGENQEKAETPLDDANEKKIAAPRLSKKSSDKISVFTKASIESAGFNKLKTGILNKRETSTVRLMKVLTFAFGAATIGFIVFDSVRNKNNLNDMGEYLKENLYFNHSKIAVCSLYFAGLNLKWIKDKHLDDGICPNKNCTVFYTELLTKAINDIKTQKENFTDFNEDFRDILKEEQEMNLVLYNLNYTEKILIDTDNLLNLIVFNGLKLKAGLRTYFSGETNGVFDIASSNLLGQSLNYIRSNISSFKGEEKEIKVKDNFKLVPISLICVAVIFVGLILGFVYLVYQIHTLEIYFLEKLINFNSPNFENYLKVLDELKKRLRNEAEADDDKDEDMELGDSKKGSKREEEEEEKKKKKEEAEEKEEKKRLKKRGGNKSNKALQQKMKKKKTMGLYFFKWNLFFTLKVVIILVITISYYLVSMVIESKNKSDYLDFDQTTDSIEGLYKYSFDIFLRLKSEMETFEERMRLKIDAINSFYQGNITVFTVEDDNLNPSERTCSSNESAGPACSEASEDLINNAIECCDVADCKLNLDGLCEAIKCIAKMPNYKMTIPSNDELTTPKLENLLMPLVSAVNENSKAAEIELNNLYNNDACDVLFGQEDKQIYTFCTTFWSNILYKGLEQAITQMGVAVSSVTDELNSLNENAKKRTGDSSDKSLITPKKFNELLLAEASFFQYGLFVEYYLFESYLKTYTIFDSLRDDKLDSIKSSFDIILYVYIIACVILVVCLLYLVNGSKYLLNSFLNFVGILPLKYLMEDDTLYHETLNLEQNVYY